MIKCIRVSTRVVYEDIRDGQNMAHNALFKIDASALVLMFHQDAFEAVGPLGSAWKKQKL